MKKATFENAIAFAQDLIRIPGLSGGEEVVASRVLEEMEALGYVDVRLDEVGNAIGRIPGRGDGPVVLLNCHMDVVAEGDHSEWEYGPFDAVVEGGCLHGRGAMDIKGPLALQTHAAAALRGTTPYDIVVAHTVFEERGGLGMKHLLESGAVRPDAVVIGEATHGDVCVGHRGRGEVEIVIRGEAGHASAPGRAKNALDAAGDVLAAVRRLAESQASDPYLGTATVVPTMVDVLPQSRNVIPDQVVVTLDWRVLPDMDADSMLGDVRGALGATAVNRTDGLTIEVRMASESQSAFTGLTSVRDLFTPGFLMDPEAAVVRAAAEAVGRRGVEGSATIRPWAFATDGGWSCGIHGIPTIGFAPGEERYAHTNRERLDLEEARWAFERHPALLTALQRTLAGEA
jgi:putative selenium metabolism hydrolase